MASFTLQEDGAIRTRRLLLRAARESDLDPLHELFSDEDVMRYWSCAPHTQPSQTSNYLTDMIASPTNGSLDFVIVLLPAPSPSSPNSTVPEAQPPHSGSTGEKVIGKAGLWSHSRSEIGFMLHRACWRRGYMAEALGALLGPRGVLWERGVERVVADVDPRNESSVGILKRFGFEETGREERTVETHLGWCDSVFLELRGVVGEGENGEKGEGI